MSLYCYYTTTFLIYNLLEHRKIINKTNFEIIKEIIRGIKYLFDKKYITS